MENAQSETAHYKNKYVERLLRLKRSRLTHPTKHSVDSVKPKMRAAKVRKIYSAEDSLLDFNPSYYPYLKRFTAAINQFASKYCEVCHKRLYESQVVVYCLTPGRIPLYLPRELISKSFIYACQRCDVHLNTNKSNSPSTSYWNNMDPGEIPEKISILSDYERRFVKFNGFVGQLEFEGKALLFAQHVIASDDQLLTRSPDSTDPAIVAKNMQQLETVQEFLFSKYRINNALNWLITNNPLYKDVAIASETVSTDMDDFSSQHVYSNFLQPFKFQAINNDARLLRASWNQSDETVFKAKNAGVQCCAMALSAIIGAHLTPPSQWTLNNCNEWLFTGDELYETVRVLCTVHGVKIPPSGFLSVKNFNVIKDYFVAFDRLFSINFDEDPAIFGNLNDCYCGVGLPLVLGLKQLFVHHSCGILITSRCCYAVMNFGNKFYFADSHSCDERGAPAENDAGTACLIECDTFYELHEVVRRATESFNELYTLDYVDVTAYQPPTTLTNQSEYKNESTLPIATSLMRLSDCSRVTNRTTFSTDDVKNNLKEEEFEWYSFFPNGKNGLREERTVPITTIDYFQTRIMSIDSRFQHNDYIFYAFLKCEYYHIKSNLENYKRKSQQRLIYIKNLYGSSAYWKTTLNDLIGQIRCLGPPHYFITFGCIDLNWLDMRKALLIADGDACREPSSLTTAETQTLIKKYPTVVCCHIIIRVKALLNYMKSDHLVLGSRLVDYWWRINFENQNTPRLQLFVWVSNTPDFNSSKEVHQLDKVISRKLPNDLELKELVMRLQSHQHTCLRNTSSSCHRGFPRPISKAKYKEKFITNYNLRLLKLWQGKMDIQPCSTIKSFAFYITKRVFKNIPTGLDKALSDTLKTIQPKDTEISPKLLKTCEEFFYESKVSIFECVFRLCKFRLHASSRQSVFLNTIKLGPKHQVLKFGNSDGSEELGMEFLKLYKKRPRQHSIHDFNSMCLLEFAMLFDPNCNGNTADSDDVNSDEHQSSLSMESKQSIALEDGTRMLIRSSPAVVTVPHITLSLDPENYFYNLLRLYYPFRSELELFYGFKTSRESFEAKIQSIKKQMSPLLKEHLSRDEELHHAFDHAHEFIK